MALNRFWLTYSAFFLNINVETTATNPVTKKVSSREVTTLFIPVMLQMMVNSGPKTRVTNTALPWNLRQKSVSRMITENVPPTPAQTQLTREKISFDGET